MNTWKKPFHRNRLVLKKGVVRATIDRIVLPRGRSPTTSLEHGVFICFTAVSDKRDSMHARVYPCLYVYVTQEWRDTVTVTTPAQILSVPLVALLTFLSQEALQGLR